jgi:hypothetical protein
MMYNITLLSMLLVVGTVSRKEIEKIKQTN